MSDIESILPAGMVEAWVRQQRGFQAPADSPDRRRVVAVIVPAIFELANSGMTTQRIADAIGIDTEPVVAMTADYWDYHDQA